MYYAQITNGVVTAVTQTAGPIDAPDMIAISGMLDIAGHSYDPATGEFTPPAAPAEARHITPLAFRRRFTKAERAAVEWAAVDKPDRPEAERQMAAALRADLKDQEQAKFIDLDDPDLIEGVATLEAYGLIAEGRATEILSAPVQVGERA